MLSPLINLNSTSDRLSGTHRDMHIHLHTNETRAGDVKRSQQKHKAHLKSRREIKKEKEERQGRNRVREMDG